MERKNNINKIKESFTCAKCGDNRFYVLDFHHLDPSIKEETIARMLSNSASQEKIKEEIQKCICLCSNCHREFHYLQNQNNNFSIQEYLSGGLV